MGLLKNAKDYIAFADGLHRGVCIRTCVKSLNKELAMDELNKCLHCNGVAEVESEPIGLRSSWWYVRCKDCTAQTSGKTKEEAIKEWNKNK